MKNTVLISIILSLFIYGFSVQAQTEVESKRLGIKLQTRLNLNLETGRSLTLNGIFPAVQFKSAKGYLHQIEVSRINLSNFSFRDDNFRNYAFSGAYEFSLPLRIFENNEFVRPYIGMGLSTLVSSSSFDLIAGRQFFQSQNAFRANIYLLPSFRRKINQQLFFDFALLVNIVDFMSLNRNIQDLTMPGQTQQLSEVTRNAFNFQQFGFRFGFGLSL